MVVNRVFICFRKSCFIFFHYICIDNPTAKGYFNNLFRCPQITTDQQCTRKFYSRLTDCVSLENRRYFV